jgi:hypothetical protein
MTTLYVAGPMTGLPNFNYAAFNYVGRVLEGAGYTVLNPVDAEKHNPTPGTPQTWDWYMRHALGMVLAADGLAVLEGWECSRGARLEVDVAHALTLPVLPWGKWIDITDGEVRK